MPLPINSVAVTATPIRVFRDTEDFGSCRALWIKNEGGSAITVVVVGVHYLQRPADVALPSLAADSTPPGVPTVVVDAAFMLARGRVLAAGAEFTYGNSRGYGGQGGQIISAFVNAAGGSGTVSCDVQMR